MRHLSSATFTALDIDPMFSGSSLRKRRCANETPRAATSPTTLPPIRMLKMTVSEMPGKRTDPVRMTESITSTATTPPVKRLSLRIDPRTEHRLVVAKQQKKHGGARQKHAGKCLDGAGQ